MADEYELSALHTQHPDRAAIDAEAHARPPVSIESECAEAWHWVMHAPQDQPVTLPPPLDPTARHQVIECDDGILRFERHTEFISLTFFGSATPQPETLELVGRCPGVQLAGARIVLTNKPAALTDMFESTRLFGGEVMFDGIIVATDFQVGDFGLVVYAVSGTFQDGFSRGRLVKRLLDLETYRMACLLGLPSVRRLTPQLQELEARAQASTTSLGTTVDALDNAIDALAAILKDVSAIRSEVHYRIAASNAYYDLVSDRLESLDETQIGQRQTLRGFVKHRLDPGMKTIRAFERRADKVASSASEALALVRTQLDHAAQRQSQELLASMEQRARQQVHLAQAVEGLSVAAITYYAVGLLFYLLKGLPDTGISDNALVALSIAPIGFIVAYLTRRAKRRVARMIK